MISLAKIDPFLYGYFLDETLEHGERVGIALLNAAKNIEVRFSEKLLLETSFETKYGTSFYTPSEGLRFDLDNIEKLAEEFPEHKETLKEYIEKIKIFRSKSQRLNCELTDALDRSGAEWGGGWGGHSNPDYGRIVNFGTEYIRSVIAENRVKYPDEDWFYRSCSYTLDAIDIIGERYREEALKKAEKCENADNKAFLLRVAKAFESVPKKPAYDFTSAMCSFMLIFALDGSDSPGRFDQYMYPAYTKTENKAEVTDLLDRLWEYFHSHRSWNLCISGSDENWNDESNELTYEILAMVRKKGYNTPNLTCRVHKNTPEKLWNAIAETLAIGTGLPALYNDDVVCTALEKIGITPEDSHDYCMNGCNQIDIFGKSHMGLEDGEVLFTKCLEFALHNGVDAMTGERVSIETGDPIIFETYERFERAFLDQLEFVTYNSCSSANTWQHLRAVFEPHPLRSCLIAGCLEKGRDYRNGGPVYNHGQILAEGIADTGDSLYAVKKLVYDEKKYTMAELIDALNADFDGYEQLYHDFKNCEKFGNDIEAVDRITARALNRFFTVLKRNRTYRGGVFTGGCSTFNRAAGYGLRTAALPNGKRKGEPLLADSIAATPGRDTNGPTAQIKSVLRYNHTDACSGFVFQNKFPKNMFNSEKGKASFIALAKAYFSGGGQQY
ncbi:MAG: pyruvate formate lyase family protein, partial [Acutalibacteraceae bacterium]|nr:pyruvate formate lyase family protein [Acutalibacteraceae bacterium]